MLRSVFGGLSGFAFFRLTGEFFALLGFLSTLLALLSSLELLLLLANLCIPLRCQLCESPTLSLVRLQRLKRRIIGLHVIAEQDRQVEVRIGIVWL